MHVNVHVCVLMNIVYVILTVLSVLRFTVFKLLSLVAALLEGALLPHGLHFLSTLPLGADLVALSSLPRAPPPFLLAYLHTFLHLLTHRTLFNKDPQLPRLPRTQRWQQ